MSAKADRRETGRWRGAVMRLGVFAAVVLVALGAYSWNRGLRYPPVQFDPAPRPVQAEAEGYSVRAEGAYLVLDGEFPARFRAFVPEPVLHLSWKAGLDEPVRLMLENLHPEAVVEGVTDLGSGRIDHFLDIAPGAPGTTTEVRVRFPERESYRFVAFGDAGGGTELDHCLDRAGQLGADFILFLGDIGYQIGDLELGITAFGNSPVPIYAAVGNHDFHGGHRYRYNIFKTYYGPLNSRFRLGGVEFLNLDTAADTLPYHSGRRGEILDEARAERADGAGPPLVVFTHRPLDDPRVLKKERPPEDAHALDRRGEAEWLRSQLLELGAQVLLAGHIHEAHDFTHEGLRQIISGEGLGDPARNPRPQLLVGEYAPGLPPAFRWAPLRLPGPGQAEEAGGNRR